MCLDIVSFKFYPDYYLIVSNPIDLKMIATKIDTNQYSTLDDMENDLLLMVSNARKYNDPKSQIYKVSIRRQRDTFSFMAYLHRMPVHYGK